LRQTAAKLNLEGRVTVSEFDLSRWNGRKNCLILTERDAKLLIKLYLEEVTKRIKAEAKLNRILHKPILSHKPVLPIGIRFPPDASEHCSPAIREEGDSPKASWGETVADRSEAKVSPQNKLK
jgi:hypothetical protein